LVLNKKGVYKVNNKWVYGIAAVISAGVLITAGAFLSTEEEGAEEDASQLSNGEKEENEPILSTEEDSEEDLIDFESIESGFYPVRRVNETEILFINDPEDYNESFRGIRNETDIDFEESTVLAVVLGVRPTGGYSIEIEEIIEKEDKLVIKAIETRPGESCRVTMAQTYPYHVVSVEKMDEEPEMELDLTVEIRECD